MQQESYNCTITIYDKTNLLYVLAVTTYYFKKTRR